MYRTDLSLSRKLFLLFWITFLILIVFQNYSYAGTKVGNGDDGADLEGATPIDSGPILDARKKAVEHLKKLNTPGISGLGKLLPEVEKTDLFLTKKDSSAALPEDQGTFHTNMKGLVYARTFAEPHAATRFFPAAKGLDQDQLVALHIHEGLHRALPSSVREDESIVSRITLSIVAPDATHDRVRDTVHSLVPQAATEDAPLDDTNLFSGSSVGYTYRKFFLATGQPTNYPITSMHIVHSHLYPFGTLKNRFGMGIGLSVVNNPTGTGTGPLDLSGHYKAFNYRGFDFGIWGVASLNTLSTEELKQSPFGRDVFVVGFNITRKLEYAYVENYTSFALPGESKQKVGAVEYTFQYGGIVDVKVRSGLRLWKIEAGGYIEMHLADYFKVNGGAFSPGFNSGRYRILSAGPEITFQEKNFAVSLFGRFLISATNDANFDFLGYLMGPGVSQGSAGVSVKLIF